MRVLGSGNVLVLVVILREGHSRASIGAGLGKVVLVRSLKGGTSKRRAQRGKGRKAGQRHAENHGREQGKECARGMVWLSSTLQSIQMVNLHSFCMSTLHPCNRSCLLPAHGRSMFLIQSARRVTH